MRKPYYLTEQGVVKLQTQLAELILLRENAVHTMQAARELGNLDENTEYISAKQNLEHYEIQIAESENIIQNAQIIRHNKSSKIKLGSTVRLKLPDGSEKQVQVVSTIEVDPLNNKISDESPLGQILLNKTNGDSVAFNTTTYVITSID